MKNVKIDKNKIENVKSAGISLSGNSSNKSDWSKIRITNNFIKNTGKRFYGEGIIVGGINANAKIKKSYIKSNRILKFKDSCISLGDKTESIKIQYNKCDQHVTNTFGSRRQYGTIVLRGKNHVFEKNTLHNLTNGRRGSNSVFSVAARGNIKVKSNKINGVYNTSYAVHTRERGIGKTPSVVEKNEFKNTRFKEKDPVHKEYGLIVRNNPGL